MATLGYAVDPNPWKVFRGYQFAKSWETAQTEDGDPDALDDLVSARLRFVLQEEDAAPIDFTTTSGELEILGTEVVATLAGSSTTSIPAGTYDVYLSVGETSTPDVLWLVGTAEVKDL